MLPHRVYRGAAGRRKRYFTLQLPIAVDSETATFVYVDPGKETLSELYSWGMAHERLWGALRDQGIQVRVVAIARDQQAIERAEARLRIWLAAAPRKHIEGLTVKEEIELIKEALMHGDDAVFEKYGGFNEALRYCVKLQQLPEAKWGPKISINGYSMWRSWRLAGGGWEPVEAYAEAHGNSLGSRGRFGGL